MTLPRIVCVSANPAVDRRLRFRDLSLGRINRATSAENMAGGKAAHVAMAAQELGARPVWLGFLGGPVGEEFAREIRNLRIETRSIHTRSRTRMNLELLEESGRITELLEPGESPSGAEMREMQRILAAGLERQWRGAAVVISGSLPAGVPASFYGPMITAGRKSGARVFVDTSGRALKASLSARPSFIKPNREEAEGLLGRKLENIAAAVAAAHALIEKGASSAAISLGAEGLVWVESENEPAWHARPPLIEGVSTVGCGDATVAGFALASIKGLAGEDAVRLATACGAANCLAKSPGRISAQEVKRLIPRIQLSRTR